jgi:curved DNA-binding protein CbpA
MVFFIKIDLLGVQRGSSTDEIKKAYFQKAK